MSQELLINKVWIYLYWTALILLLPFYLRLIQYILKDNSQIEIHRLITNEMISIKKQIHYLDNCISALYSALEVSNIHVMMPSREIDDK